LLGQLREEHFKNPGPTGVVPKDLGFGFIKDLIEMEEYDDDMMGGGATAKNRRKSIKVCKKSDYV
jgi:hypothetical protein